MIQLQDKGIHFCMRMKDDWWNEVNAMRLKNETDKRVIFKLPKKDSDLLETMENKLEEIERRILMIRLENGMQEVLCTTLLDEEKYKYEDFADLYHCRWGIEEAYKEFKCVMELENFSGKTPIAIEQDFFAKIFMMTICSIVSHPINNKVHREYAKKQKEKKNKHQRKINRRDMISFVRNVWEDLILKKMIEEPLHALEKILVRTTQPIINGRSCARKKTPKKPPPQAYKRI